MRESLHVRRVVLRAVHRTYEWRLSTGVTVVVGPGSVGKTSLLDLIKWGLGGGVLLSPAVRTVGRQVMLDLEIGEQRLGLVRGIRTGRNQIQVLNQEGDVETTLSVDPSDERHVTASDFLLEAFGIPRLQVPRSERNPGEDLTRITFNDVLSYLYLDQDEIARSTVHHLDRYRDVKRRQTFELLYGLMDSDIAALKRDIAAARASRERLETEIAAIQPFLERSGQLEEAELKRRADRLRGEIAVAERETALLRGQARQVSEPSAESRARLESLQSDRDAHRAELAQNRIEADRYRRVRAQLVQDLTRNVKAVVAAPLFAAFEFSTCPRCLQALERDVERDHCLLCGQAEPEHPGISGLTSERARLEAQLQETEELLSSAESHGRELELLIEKIESELEVTRERLDAQTRDSVAPYVDRMSALAELVGRSRAELQALETSRRYLQEMARLREEIEQRRHLTADLEERLGTAEAEQELAGQRVSDLSEIFAQILTDLELPWLREAHIDPESYLPIVNGERLEGLSSGSMKALINTSYFLAGLTYAVRGFPSLLPRFMMIDSPRVHHGAGRADRQAGERIYRWLMRLQQALNDRAPFMGGRSFQLLVADNDLPTFVRGLHVKRFSREEPLLFDVPGLDDDELLAQLQRDEEGKVVSDD